MTRALPFIALHGAGAIDGAALRPRLDQPSARSCRRTAGISVHNKEEHS
jgi:hypothetical protein